MTTRNFEVITKEEDVYKLKPLSDENSKKLFYRKMLSQKGASPDDISIEVSSRIVDKCGGIPLAINAIASLLIDRPCEDWSKVYDSIGFGNEDNTKKILSYSYYDLPSYLKPCLLHLGIFLEDCIVHANSVIWMWIGEGFVHGQEEQCSLFEVGERYFKELVNRSMLEPTKDTYDPFTQWFRIHDIVFDLIRELLRGENFVTILGSREKHASLDSLRREKKTSMSVLGSKVRRLVVQNHHVPHIPQDNMDKGEVLRSLYILHSKVESMAQLGAFRVCRVLNIQKSYVPMSLSKHLGKLLHLKYLEISSTVVDELPKEIGHLKSLKTLLLANIGLQELPPAVSSLTQLMCLIVEGFKKLPADRMGDLTSLEELRLHSVVGRSATKDIAVSLSKLTRLRVVSITFSKKLEESLQKVLVRSLRNLQELQELVIFSSEYTQPGDTIWERWEPPSKLRRLVTSEGIRFWRLPGWITSSRLPRLCFLSLNVYVVEVHDLDSLARLPELSYLEQKGGIWPPGYTVGTDGFKNLRFCHVGTTLKFHMGAMPKLEELEFGVFLGHGSFEANGVLLEQFPTNNVTGNLDLGLYNLLSLEQVTVEVDCLGATAAEVQEVEAVVRRAMEDHPNRPTIKMDRVFEEHMISDEKQEALLQQHIKKLIGVLEWKDKPDAFFISWLRWYRRLQKAVFSIDCASASMCDVEKVEAGFRHAADVHPNHPTIQLIWINTGEILSSSDHSNTEQDARDDTLDNSLSKLQLKN